MTASRLREIEIERRALEGEPAALALLLSVEAGGAERAAAPAALGSSAGASAEVTRRVERLVGALSLQHLPIVVSLLHARAPAALLEPRVRSALDVALELEVLAPERLAALLGPLLRSEERLQSWLRSDASAPLPARLHAAAVCRAVGAATSFTGTLAPLVAAEHQPLFWLHVRRLFLDRSPRVGARAAWAVGLLAAVAPEARLLVEGARRARPGLERRRGLVAFAAQCLSGELDDAELVPELLQRSGKDDPNAAAAVVQALTQAVRAAPDTCRGIVEDLLAAGPPEVAPAAAAFAHALPSRQERDALLANVRELARRGTSDDDDSLAFWLGPRAPSTEALLDAATAAAELARSSLEGAAEAALALVADVAEAAERVSQGRGALATETDRALEVVLFDSPLCRDLVVASAPSPRARAERREAWDLAAIGLVSKRLERASARGRSVGSERDRLTALATALDAAPRAASAQGGGELAPWFVGAAREALRLSLTLALGRDLERLERSLASVAAAALDPLVSAGAQAPGDLIAVLLREVEPAFVRALSTAIASPELRATLACLIELRTAATRAAKGGHNDELAQDLSAKLSELSLLVLRLAPTGDPLAEGLLHLARATNASLGREQAREGLGSWGDAAEQLGEAQRKAAERLGLPSPRTLSRKKIDPPLLAVLDPEARLSLLHAEDPIRERAIEKAADSLPPALRLVGVVALRALLQGERKKARRASARASRTEVVPPGTKIGDYVVVRALGSGAMGHCLLVRPRRDAGNARAPMLVLKLPREGSDLLLFRREAVALLTLAQTPHASVVRFASFVDVGYRVPFLVMGLAEGVPMDAALRGGAFARRDALRLGEQLAEGLACAHQLSVGHYDLKPANVVVAPDRARAVLVDWGLAGATLAGTPSYMSPERWDAIFRKAHEPPQPSSDVFGLGCLLYEMAAGKALLDPALSPEERARYRDVLTKIEATPAAGRDVHLVSVLARDQYQLFGRVDAVFRKDPLGAVIKAAIQQAPGSRPTARDLAATLAHFAASA